MKRIGILSAGDRELAPFLPLINHPIIESHAMLTFHCGTLSEVEVVAVYSGVCKVNAAIAAQILIDHFRVDAILNTGTAGGMDPTLQIMDTVISTQTAYHDVALHILTEFHPWMDTIFFEADPHLLACAKQTAEQFDRVWFGRTVTGEAFITEDGRASILERFSPLTVDMETAAIAHVCYANRIPFLSVRTVTDTADHAGSEAFEQNCNTASERSKDFICTLIKILYEAKGVKL